MRMRRKKHGAERIAAVSHLLISSPEELMSSPQASFPEERKLCLEIGCGKGSFACGTAAANPDMNLIAMERVADVACLALEKAESEKENRPGDNLRFIIGNAQNLAEWFPQGCLDRIYLNFSDPWPKAGYAKRRLTHINFLNIYKKLLKKGGMLYFKTDNVSLFEFSLEQFALAGLKVQYVTNDLHNSEYNIGNIMTEYERNFTEKGVAINAAAVIFD